MKKNIVIIILSVIILGLGGYLVYDKVIDKNDKKTPEDECVIKDDNNKKTIVSDLVNGKVIQTYVHNGQGAFELQENGVYDVNLDIVCERANHKAILIGKQGRAIKEVSSFARQDMEKFLGAKVFLTTYVKVKEDWRDKAGLLREYGYEDLKDD